ncbi:HNH endonuclease signature motif containing protein [Geodermatophilus africanus]|nr:HNH endonuclease signature motif containing protein [Geodermatophilus africanus]
MTSAGSLRTPIEAALVGRLLERPPTTARLPVGALTRAEKAAELQRLQARKTMDAAYEAELVLGLADDTPDTLDPPPDQPGAKTGSWAPEPELPGVSQFFTAELAVVLNCGRRTAAHLAQRAWTYRARLPATWAALAEGALDEPRARVLADVLGPTSPAVARQVEARLLPEATQLSTGRLRARSLALLLELDSEAVDQRREAAQRSADVRSYPSPLEGMSTLAADLPTPVSAECLDVVDRLAGMLKADGDPRPIGQLRAAVLADLIRRPWHTGLPGVTAQLTIAAALDALAGRTDRPGEVNGQPITAAALRELLTQLGTLELRAPEGGTLTCALTDADGALRATATLDQLRRLARRGCRQHPHGDCGCPLLDRPPATGAYTPTAAQHAFVTTRDRACRFPHCGQRVGWADRDHVIPHAHGGATDCANLCCLCRSHHRLKTLARGWRFVMDDDGTLHVTTPSGVTRTTRPPGMRPPAPDPPERNGAPRWPPPPQDADPPPF